MVVRVNDNSEHYNGATLVINHRRSHYLELRNASIGRLRTRLCARTFLAIFPTIDFYLRERRGTRARAPNHSSRREIREPSTRALAPLWFTRTCVFRVRSTLYAIQSVGRKTSTMADRDTKRRARIPVDKSGHVGNFRHVKISRATLPPSPFRARHTRAQLSAR